MKKFFCILLTIFILFSFSGCSNTVTGKTFEFERVEIKWSDGVTPYQKNSCAAYLDSLEYPEIPFSVTVDNALEAAAYVYNIAFVGAYFEFDADGAGVSYFNNISETFNYIQEGEHLEITKDDVSYTMHNENNYVTMSLIDFVGAAFLDEFTGTVYFKCK